MDTTTFDSIARNLSSTITLRSVLRGLFAGAAAAVAGGILLQADDASAKRRRRRKSKKTQQTQNPTQGGSEPLLAPGSRCEFSSQCTSTNICAVPVNGSNSDHFCCGATGAVCGNPNPDTDDDTAPFCCVGFTCHSNVCQPVPES